jgi:hypothetical protein
VRPERLALVIQSYQDARLSHPELEDTPEAIPSLLEGVAAGEIPPARLARACYATRRCALPMCPSPPSSTARLLQLSSASSAMTTKARLDER